MDTESTDTAALDQIHAAMDGAEWDSDLWDIVAAFVLATGRAPFRDPNDDDLDYWSSASRQHYIDTGRFLAVGEALDA